MDNLTSPMGGISGSILILTLICLGISWNSMRMAVYSYYFQLVLRIIREVLPEGVLAFISQLGYNMPIL